METGWIFGALAVELGHITPERFVASSQQAVNRPAGVSLKDAFITEGGLGADAVASIERQMESWQAYRSEEETHGEPSISQPNYSTVTVGLGEDSGDKSPGGTVGWTAPPNGTGGGRFAKLRPLAKGGLGLVSVARDRQLEREVALKEMLNPSDASAESQDRFLSEARITGRLEHPSIVPVYGLGHTSDGLPYYAMRLIKGHSLHEEQKEFHQRPEREKTIRSDNDAFRKLVRALIDASNAIAYAHSRSVVHRDVKPHNIMVGKYGETIVVDWGLAKVLDSNDTPVGSEMAIENVRSGDSSRTSLGSVMGTPGYMSPEQAEGRIDQLDGRSDVFSLGASLYALMTNSAPYDGKGKAGVVAARAGKYPDPKSLNPDAPVALVAICKKAMSLRPQDRYATPKDFGSDLDRWIADEPIKAMKEPSVQRVMRAARRHQTLVASSVALLVTALVASILAGWAIGKQRDIALAEKETADNLRLVAVDEREKADSAREDAEDATERATRHGSRAIALILKFAAELGDEEWAKVPGSALPRVAIVDSAVDQMKLMSEGNPTSLELKTALIKLLNRSCTLHRSVGQFSIAREQIEYALQLVEQLPDLLSSDDYCGLRNDVMFNYAAVARNSDGQAKAFALTQQSLDFTLARIAEHPGSIMAQLALARINLLHGEYSNGVGRPATGEIAAKDGGELLETLIGQLKGRISDTQLHALEAMYSYAYTLKATCQREQGRLEEAVASVDQGLLIATAAQEAAPEDQSIADFLQQAAFEKAKLLHAMGKPDASLELSLTALDGYLALSKKYPALRPPVLMQAKIHAQRAIVLVGVGEDDEAVLEATNAIQLVALLEENELSVVHFPIRIQATAALVLAAPPESEERPDLRDQLNEQVATLESLNSNHPILGLPSLAKAIRQSQ